MNGNDVVRYFLTRTLGSVLIGTAMGNNLKAVFYFLFLWLVADISRLAIRELNKPDW